MSSLLAHQRQLLGIAKGWALKNLPGWADECHRDLIALYGAKRINTAGEARISALTMSSAQIAAALADYEARGWPRQRQHKAAGQARPVPPRIAHIARLWGRIGQAGKVQNASRPALLAFCARQTRRDVASLDALSVAECAAITEALKSWLAR